jgi:hypothetical protein
MNKFALLSVFLILLISAKAQDRIISMNHDTIHCTILSINKKHIKYELKDKDGLVTLNSINIQQVSEYTRSHRTENDWKQHNLKTSNPDNVPESLWNVGLNVGGSTMPWYFDNIQSTAAMPDYYNKLKTGFHINTSAYYMINGYLGVGAEYSFFDTSFSGSEPSQYSTTIFLMVSEKYRQYINYVGPSVFLQQHIGIHKKFILSESLSAGVLFIRLEGESTFPNIDNTGYSDFTNNSLLTGNSLSAKFGLNASYRIYRNVSVGLGGNYIWASLKKASFESRGTNNESSSTENQELPKPMNLSRIDYSFVLRYQF